MKDPNGASENDKGSSHLKNIDIESDRIPFDEKTGHRPFDALARTSNVDHPQGIMFCDSEEIMITGADNRKRGLGKMLDIKEHEE